MYFFSVPQPRRRHTNLLQLGAAVSSVLQNIKSSDPEDDRTSKGANKVAAVENSVLVDGVVTGHHRQQISPELLTSPLADSQNVDKTHKQQSSGRESSAQVEQKKENVQGPLEEIEEIFAAETLNEEHEEQEKVFGISRKEHLVQKVVGAPVDEIGEGEQSVRTSTEEKDATEEKDEDKVVETPAEKQLEVKVLGKTDVETGERESIVGIPLEDQPEQKKIIKTPTEEQLEVRAVRILDVETGERERKVKSPVLKNTSMAFPSGMSLPPLRALVHTTFSAEQIPDVVSKLQYRPLKPSDKKQLDDLHVELLPILYDDGVYDMMIDGRENGWVSIAACAEQGDGKPDVLCGFCASTVTRMVVSNRDAELLARMFGKWNPRNPEESVNLCGYLTTLGVAERFRRQGIAKQLVNRSIKALMDKYPKLQIVYIHVIPFDTAAIQLYEKLGFKRVAIQPGYYSFYGQPYSGYIYAKLIREKQHSDQHTGCTPDKPTTAS